MPLPPDVDFSSLMVIAVFRGEFPTGGYSTEIMEVTGSSGKITVTVDETDPGGGMALQVLTQPYHIIKLGKSHLPVEFVYR